MFIQPTWVGMSWRRRRERPTYFAHNFDLFFAIVQFCQPVFLYYLLYGSPGLEIEGGKNRRRSLAVSYSTKEWYYRNLRESRIATRRSGGNGGHLNVAGSGGKRLSVVRERFRCVDVFEKRVVRCARATNSWMIANLDYLFFSNKSTKRIDRILFIARNIKNDKIIRIRQLAWMCVCVEIAAILRDNFDSFFLFLVYLFV